MKRLVFVVILLGIIFVLGRLVSDEVRTYISNASLLIKGINSHALTEQIKNDVISAETLGIRDIQKQDIDVSLKVAHIDSDTEEDIIATITSEKTCGSGGCITFLYQRDESGKFKQITFAYAVKTIEVENSMTNGMHDLKINNDEASLMKWDGTQYTLNSY